MDYEINGSIENYKMEVSLITPTPAYLVTRKKPYRIFYETYSINLNSSDGTDQECNTGKTFSFPSELTLVILVNANWHAMLIWDSGYRTQLIESNFFSNEGGVKHM